MKTAIVKKLACTFASLLVFCAGNGSEIPTQAGKNPSGTYGQCLIASDRADSAIIIAYPRGYNPTKPASVPDTVFADSNGAFSIVLGDSAYNLLMYDKSRSLGAFVPVEHDSSVGKIELDSLGGVIGEYSRDTLPWIFTVGIVGAPFYTYAHNGLFEIDHIPPYQYQLTAWGMPRVGCAPGECLPGSNDVPDTVMGRFVVTPGETSNVVFGR